MEIDAKLAAELLTNISGAIGSDNSEQIEAAMTDLLQVEEFVKTVGNEIDSLNSDVESLNNRNQGLQAANNKALRKIALQVEEEKVEDDEPDYINNFVQAFERDDYL